MNINKTIQSINSLLATIFGVCIVRSSNNKRYVDVLKNSIGSACPIIFDVGAHHGQSAGEFLKIFPNSRVYSFEPFKDSFDILVRDFGKNVSCHNFGLGDKREEIKFYTNINSATNSILELRESAGQIWNNSSLSSNTDTICNFVPLDNFVLENNICQIDLLKIDVQGSEYKVLYGAIDSLNRKVIKSIYMEVIFADTYKFQKDLKFYLNMLGEYGYHLHGIYNLVYGSNGNTLQCDIIMMPKNDSK